MLQYYGRCEIGSSFTEQHCGTGEDQVNRPDGLAVSGILVWVCELTLHCLNFERLGGFGRENEGTIICIFYMEGFVHIAIEYICIQLYVKCLKDGDLK